MHEVEKFFSGELVVYRREVYDGVFQVRIRKIVNNKTEYIRKSLKTRDKDRAIELAIRFYRENQSRLFLGLSSDFVSIEDLLALASDQSFKEVSEKAARSFYNSYWKEWFSEKDCAKIKTQDIREYFVWRVDKQLNSENERKWKPSDESVSTSTLKYERNLLRKLFEVGKGENLIARVPRFPERFKYKTHTIAKDERRARFTSETYEIVRKDFVAIRRLLNQEEFQPIKGEDGVFQSWSRYNGVGSSKKLEEEKRWAVKERSRFARAQYWFISILIANTGIRPSEVVKLKHKHISVVKSRSDGSLYTRIEIPREVSKVGKFRDVISSDFHQTYERYLDYRREIEFRYSVDISQEDWMFPKTGSYEDRIDKLSNLIRPHLVRIGLHKKKSKSHNDIEVYYSAYSFRSWYITKRLENGLNIYTLAKNCGTSIKTIAETYDYSENWAFRKEMTAHLNEHSSSDAPKYNLASHILEWK
jgi:integrase